MKKRSLLFLCVLAILLGACTGSDTYRGSWKATNAGNSKFDITFSEKEFSIVDSAGNTKSFPYTQHSWEVSNSIATYGIQLEDGRNYQIHFPLADNDSLAVIRDGNGLPLYTISRKEYLSYDQIYQFK